MNHLEQIVSEWLAFRGYFVRTGVRVGALARGGYLGELDVIAFHPGRNHFIHVECSLDALSKSNREQRFMAKFERGRTFAPTLFAGLTLPDHLDQAAVLTFVPKRSPSASIGGGRLIATRELMREIVDGLRGTSPISGAVPEAFPLIRTIQLMADATGPSLLPASRLLPPVDPVERAQIAADLVSSVA